MSSRLEYIKELEAMAKDITVKRLGCSYAEAEKHVVDEVSGLMSGGASYTKALKIMTIERGKNERQQG